MAHGRRRPRGSLAPRRRGQTSGNDEEQSVRAIIVTETPCLRFDIQSGQVVDEILMVDGGDGTFRTPLTLQRDHDTSVDATIGSVGQPRKLADVRGDAVLRR